MKVLVLIFALFSFAFSSGTYGGYFFTDSEEKYSLFFVNFYPQSDLVNIGLAPDDVSSILLGRSFPTLTDVTNIPSLSSSDLLRIREMSHLVVIPDQSGASDINATFGVHQYEINYLHLFVGILVGFLFALGMILTAIQIGRGK